MKSDAKYRNDKTNDSKKNRKQNRDSNIKALKRFEFFKPRRKDVIILNQMPFEYVFT